LRTEKGGIKNKDVKRRETSSGAPECQKSWLGHAYVVGIICSPPEWERVTFSAKNWLGPVPTFPYVLAALNFIILESGGQSMLGTRFRSRLAC
jgi:hypothetical protein